MRMDGKRKAGLASWFIFVFFIILSIIMLYPFYSIILLSFKSLSEFRFNPIGIPQHWTFANYSVVFVKGHIFNAFLGSTFLTATSIAAIIFFGSLTAYAITKMYFKKAKLFSLAFLAPMVFPIQTVIIPLYFQFKILHLINNLWGLVIIFTATNLSLGIFVLTGFMKTIPLAISESAFVDGASHFDVYTKLILPLIKPAIVTTIIIIGIFIWNDFYTPLIMYNLKDFAPLPLKIYMFAGLYEMNWPMICTTVVYISLPVIATYLLLQKYIIGGVVAGSVKG